MQGVADPEAGLVARHGREDGRVKGTLQFARPDGEGALEIRERHRRVRPTVVAGRGREREQLLETNGRGLEGRGYIDDDGVHGESGEFGA
jgi:hypothetical protein